jgi:hypothetical protein
MCCICRVSLLNCSSFTGEDGNVYCEEHINLDESNNSRFHDHFKNDVYFSDNYFQFRDDSLEQNCCVDQFLEKENNPKTSSSLASTLLAKAVKKSSPSIFSAKKAGKKI